MQTNGTDRPILRAYKMVQETIKELNQIIRNIDDIFQTAAHFQNFLTAN